MAETSYYTARGDPGAEPVPRRVEAGILRGSVLSRRRDASPQLEELAPRPAADVVSHALHGVLRGRERQAAAERLLPGLARRGRGVGKEPVRQPVRQRIGHLPHQREHVLPLQRVLEMRGGRRDGPFIWETPPRPGSRTRRPSRRAWTSAATAARTARWPTNSWTALLEDREPAVNIYEALAMTAPGIVAHRSALAGRAMQGPVPVFDEVPSYDRA